MSVKIIDRDLQAILQEKIAECAANDLPLQIVGGSSKAFYGNASKGDALEVAGHSGIIDYDPAELVITCAVAANLPMLKPYWLKMGRC